MNTKNPLRIALLLSVVALTFAPMAEARRNTTDNPPPPAGTDDKPVFSPL